jgi:hypothetical protein
MEKDRSGKGTMGGKKGKYTCNDYREEMILLGLQKRLNQPGLSEKERQEILKEIAAIEEQMGM